MITTKSDISLLEKSAVALGAFDGIHKAHQKLIEKAVLYGKQHNVKSAVFTFDHNPSGAPRITPSDARADIFSKLGVDVLFVQNFDNDFKKMTSQEFMNKYLLKCSFVCLGFNYRFGKNRQGSAKDIETFCEKNNIDCFVLKPVMGDGQTVSSSLIRKYIENNDFFSANKLLGRNFFVAGIVVNGDKIGRTIGFPTVNLEQHNLLIKNGVYATITEIDGKRYKSITNVGGKPTIKEGIDRIETHIIDYIGDAYGKHIKTEFIAKIRDIIRFSSIDELKEQLSKDIEYSKSLIDII